MTAKRIYGIDLGTTYSCIAYVDDSGRPTVVPNSEGDATTPSVVYFEGDGKVVVGKEAKNTSKLFPDRVIAFVKREMGNPTFSFEVDDRNCRPEEISSFVLRKLVKDAAEHVGEEITDVVITCPAYFGINEREATKNAGRLAGLNVRHILNEPTAAAICYGVEKTDGERVVLVYDLGGGTFDITVVSIKDRDISVIFTDGNHSLGGKDWDERLMMYFSEEFTREHPDKGNPLDDPESLQQLVLMAEDTKRSLSTREKSPQAISHAGVRTRIELTREKFEDVTRDLLEQTISLTTSVIAAAKQRGISKIDQLLLVGGSSRMPYVARRLKEATGLEPMLFEPDLSVAKGAALMGLRILAGEQLKEELAIRFGVGTVGGEIDLKKVDQKTLEQAAQTISQRGGNHLTLPAREIAALGKSEIVNVCSRGFGLELCAESDVNDDCIRKEVVFLIHSNTPVPTKTLQTFGTLKADQRGVDILVQESKSTTESPDPEHSNEIGTGEITGLPAGLPKGSPVDATFSLERDGTLAVTAVDRTSGRELKLSIQIKGVMTSEEVEQKKGGLLKMMVT